MERLTETEAQIILTKLRTAGVESWFGDHHLDALIQLRHHRAIWMQAYLLAKDARCSDELVHAMGQRDARNRMSPLVHWSELPDMPDHPWIVDNLIRRGGMSIFAGEPKVGKSTVVCELVSHVLNGTPFIDRECEPSRVLYYSLEEIGEEIKKRFAKYITFDAPLFVREGYVPASEFVQILEEDIETSEAELVIIDPLFDVVDVESTNDYVPVNRAIKEFLYVARKTGVHIHCVHHSAKAGGILGTQSLRGGTDANLYLVKNVKTFEREFHSENRYGAALDTYHVRMNAEEKLYFEYAVIDTTPGGFKQ